MMVTRLQRAGLPHSDISGSKPVCSSPELVAAYHVLHRLRAKALYQQDEGMALRKSHESPVVKELYDTYLGEPGSHKAHELLHCTYVPQKRYRME